MSRSRTVREGSVGLLALSAVAVFGGVFLWLRGVNFVDSGYKIVGEFPDVNGLQVGDPVRYRGIKIGSIRQLKPRTNGVDVVMDINSSDILVPKNAVFKANSSGLIGQTFIEIEPPTTSISQQVQNINPGAKNCNRELVVCNGEKIKGIPGITLDDVLPLTYELSKQLSEQPEIIDNVNSALANASVAAAEISQLSRDVSVLVNSLQNEVGKFSEAATAVTNLANNASGQINATTKKYQDTAEKLNQIADNTNQIITQNKGNLTATLNNISTTSDRLQGLVNKLDNTVATANTKELVENLETLTANAANASANLKEISDTFGDSNNLVALQQTLDSARVTFANAQKITTDLEDITGDSDFLDNVKNLVDGLSSLVSTTEKLEREVNITRKIESKKDL